MTTVADEPETISGGDASRARWIRVAVTMLEHPVVGIEPNRSYSRYEAFQWLLTHAAFSDHRTRNKDKVVILQRGQVLVGRDHLAKEWRWSAKKVRNFLAQLQRENMIKMGQSEGHYANVATVCNYDKFQTAQKPKGQRVGQSGASDGPERGHTLGNNTKNTEEGDLGGSDVGKAFAAYNLTAKSCGLPIAGKLTADRAKKISARLDEYGLEGWHTALANIERSSFLTGSNDRGFRASLDLVCKAESFGKLHDGSYGNGRHATPASFHRVAPDAVRFAKPAPEVL